MNININKHVVEALKLVMHMSLVRIIVVTLCIGFIGIVWQLPEIIEVVK